MDDNTFKRFLIINQIITGKSTVTCVKCNNWLTSPIYMRNSVNYCSQCKPRTGERNLALEDILNNYKYPCANENCEYLLAYNQIAKHDCGNLITCTFCQTECNQRKIAEHLIDEHNAQFIHTNEPKFSITINIPFANKLMHLVEIYNTQFLLMVEQELELIKCILVKLIDDINGTKTYNVRLTTSLRRTMCYDGVLQQFGETDALANEIELYVGKADCCTLEISLGSPQQMNAPACPLCMYPIGSKLRQCVNGHIVCEDCGGKINACPICYMNIDESVYNVQHLYPDAILACTNYRNGCMAYLTNREYSHHVEICAFRSVKCPACALSIRKCDINSHMKFDHALKNNFEVLENNLSVNNIVGNCTAYILFDMNIFKCHITSDGNNIEFKCDLAHRNSQCNQQYRFEYHILYDINATKAMHILNDVISDNSNSCSMSWQKLSQTTLPLFIRCCIFKEKTFVSVPCADVEDKLLVDKSISRVIAMHRPRVFFDINSATNQPVCRLVMELRSDVVPMMAEYFRALCTHEKGYGFKGTKLCCATFSSCLKLMKRDIDCNDQFASESKLLKYCGAGTLAMFDTNPNFLLFYIVFSVKPPNWVNKGNAVIFGQVVEGLNAFKKITDASSIVNCGQL